VQIFFIELPLLTYYQLEMSYTQEEIELLKDCLKEICDENYFSQIHELKKKLVALTAREKELDLKATRCQEELKALRENHASRPYTIEYRDAATQTEQSDPKPENKQAPVVINLATAQTNGNTNHGIKITTTSSAEDNQYTLNGNDSVQKEPVRPKMEPVYNIRTSLTEKSQNPKPPPEKSVNPRPQTEQSQNPKPQPELICISDDDD
jgi:membrane-bound lytic murein transglycosylase